MKTLRLSCAHALFKFLIAQKTIIDGKKAPLFPGAFAIYGLWYDLETGATPNLIHEWHPLLQFSLNNKTMEKKHYLQSIFIQFLRRLCKIQFF